MRMLTTPRRSWIPSLDADFDRLFDRFSPMISRPDESLGMAEWNPAVDIREEADRFLVLVDIPGVAPEEVDITLENGLLTISGERKEEKSTGDEHYRRSERFHGSFFRRFSLPDTADATKVSARSDKGVVEITIPKTKKARSNRIPIKS
ncbi:Hsp20/alpha crystallin family protein [Natronospira bacteriovora]|uniref:Hsp20/alpha crystallin family protein n=1 Tax=Natronospira bacteriovora TaxID=3069753 RepID=A0ABU0W4W0_9GAMM|nr:Hsp20/alpha crystallin family protein [Natronospira sp. AB-CW4]MDQ2069054.1 Hsp20/alpha crystallin family protein [Natronospira sp. AB-CW4]